MPCLTIGEVRVSSLHSVSARTRCRSRRSRAVHFAFVLIESAAGSSAGPRRRAGRPRVRGFGGVRAGRHRAYLAPCLVVRDAEIDPCAGEAKRVQGTLRARAAIEMPCGNLNCRALGVPLHRFLSSAAAIGASVGALAWRARTRAGGGGKSSPRPRIFRSRRRRAPSPRRSSAYDASAGRSAPRGRCRLRQSGLGQGRRRCAIARGSLTGLLVGQAGAALGSRRMAEIARRVTTPIRRRRVVRLAARALAIARLAACRSGAEVTKSGCPPRTWRSAPSPGGRHGLLRGLHDDTSWAPPPTSRRWRRH